MGQEGFTLFPYRGLKPSKPERGLRKYRFCKIYMNDQDLYIIRRVLNGEQQAYAQLVDLHKDKAMTLAVRMLRNRSEAEEAVQDAFVRAFRALAGFQGNSSFSTWFYRIVFNVCSTQLNKRKGEPVFSFHDEENDPVTEIVSDDETPDVQLEEREYADAVLQEIKEMDEEYAAILTLFYVQDLGYDEIVDVTGLPLGTVKTRIRLAMMKLRESLGAPG